MPYSSMQNGGGGEVGRAYTMIAEHKKTPVHSSEATPLSVVNESLLPLLIPPLQTERHDRLSRSSHQPPRVALGPPSTPASIRDQRSCP